MEKSRMLEMAFLLIQDQKRNKTSKDVSFVLMDSYVYHTGFKKEDVLKFMKNEKLSSQKSRQISLGIVIFQISRRGLIHESSQMWQEHYVSCFCKFVDSSFLGFSKNEWVEFFISCCENKKKKRSCV